MNAAMNRSGRGAGFASAAIFLLTVLPGELRPAADVEQRNKAFQEQVRPYLKQNCAACHNARAKTAGVALDGFSHVSSITADGPWEKVLRKLRTGEMPPSGMPRPPVAATNAVLEIVGSELDRAAEAKPNPGRVAIHRLNRAEYNNAVRDLLAVDFRPADGFPADDSGYGFDNIADVLSLPPMLMEKYLSAAGRVSRLALGRVRFDPLLERVNAPRNVSQNGRLENAPLSSRGGMLLEHRFPADAEYVIRVRLRGTPDDKVAEVLDYTLDGKPLKRIEAKFGTNEEDEELRRLEVRVPLTAGKHRVMVTFLRDDSKNESPRLEYTPAGTARRNPPGVDWIEIAGPYNVTGPGQTESRRKILTCQPSATKSEDACATEILNGLAHRAFRRPVSAAETARLLKFFHMGGEDSKEFEGGLELGIKSILVSPNFLFRIERDPKDVKPGTVYEVSDLELASRLSFFLWSTIPDDTLLSLAERGELKKPEVFEAQVRRMLQSPRARELTTNFAGQWLHLRNLASVKPDPEIFPGFDNDLRNAMQRETEMFFEAILKENRSVLEFIDSRFTFLNARLATYYGIAGVEGPNFRRVELADGSRGGVMTMASVLAVTSYPTRTSPVIRGKWVLENLLGGPPPPPPPDIPPLKEAGLGKTVSMRQQLEQHRANPSCAGCHAKMDPIGFALENYDAVGRFRTRDGGFDVDAAGKLPSGESFRNAAELKQILRAQPQEFVLCFSEKLLTYALGRGVESSDKPLLRALTRESAKDDYRFSSIILGITKSAPFRMRRAAEPASKAMLGKEGLHANN